MPSRQSSKFPANTKTIPGLSGCRAGTDGVVWTCIPRGRPARHKSRKTTTWRIVKPCPDKKGYLWATLNGHNYRVHHLVLRTFVGPCPEGMQCCHEDGNPSNNKLNNLRWDTPKANADDRKRHERTSCGERHGSAKLADTDLPEIRQLHKSGVSLRQIGKQFGVSHVAILYAIRR